MRVALHLVVPVVPYDDACLTFQVVDKLARGARVFCNPGEPVIRISTYALAAWLPVVRATHASLIGRRRLNPDSE